MEITRFYAMKVVLIKMAVTWWNLCRLLMRAPLHIAGGVTAPPPPPLNARVGPGGACNGGSEERKDVGGKGHGGAE